VYFSRLLRFVCFAILSTLLPMPGIHAETINCTAITSLPSIITTQGVYCLSGDLATDMATGNSIEIQTNNVTIDLNGHKLGGAAAGPGTTAIGIYALDRNNITIRNGTIRGFRFGILLEDNSTGFASSGGHVLEELRTDANTIVGLYVFGRGNIIRNNQVLNTGGSTIVNPVFGILADGPSTRLMSNDVNGTNGGTSNSAYGIYVASAPNSFIENNRISDGNGSTAYGIYVSNAANNIIENNRIASTNGAAGACGIYVDATITGYGISISGNRIVNFWWAANTTGIYLGTWNLYSSVRDNTISNMDQGIKINAGNTIYMGNIVTGSSSATTKNFYGGVAAGTNASSP
jgi:parallel beta-helix repeat protein